MGKGYHAQGDDLHGRRLHPESRSWRLGCGGHLSGDGNRDRPARRRGGHNEQPDGDASRDPGLKSLELGCRVTLYTDSQYLRDGITKWMAARRRCGWKTKDRKEVKNRDLWEQLAAECDRHAVTWAWVKGHAGDKWNERADALATRAQAG